MDGLRLFSAEDALNLVPKAFFQNHPTEARTVLAIMPDASRLLGKLLDGGHTRAAGRLAGALRSIGSDKIADEIVCAMKAPPMTCERKIHLSNQLWWQMPGA